tara:strand:- start:2417 stop:2905 length:489 start_codon:yes stop_codon:yes gene_type:complete
MYDTLFLDRDGVINRKLEARYVTNFNEFEFIQNSDLAIRELSKIFKRIFIVTNQQGVGKGIMSENDLNNLHRIMQDQLSSENKYIEKIYYCPHVESDLCNCRKPKTGMLEQAKKDFPEINIKYSFLVGDSNSDIQAGNKFGLQTVKLDSNYTLYHWLQEISL